MHPQMFVLVSTCLLLSVVAGEIRMKPVGSLDDGTLPSEAPMPVAKGVAPRVTVESSNMPASLQVAAAEALKLAYQLHDTDQTRLELFTALLRDIEPSYQWNAIVAYQHFYYIAYYYIRLRTDDGDLVFAFSSNN